MLVTYLRKQHVKALDDIQNSIVFTYLASEV